MIKGIVQPKLIFHPFTTHHFLDGGSGDIFKSSFTDGKKNPSNVPDNKII